MLDFASVHIASDVPDALKALQAAENPVVICGGSDVLIRLREGKLSGCALVSVRNIPGLADISLQEDGTLVIGPAAAFSQVTENALVQKYVPTLGEAVDQAGGPQLRNVGTVGGNLCNGATSADSPPSLLTLNAELEITGPGGVRHQALEDFFAGPGRVKLEKDELLTAIRIAKANYDGYFGHYIKFAQRSAMDIATLGCAVHVKLDESKTKLADVRLAYGVAAPTPIRCHAAEDAVRGKSIEDETFRLFGEIALTEVKPRSSWRASEAFRRQLIDELAQRALKVAIEKARGEAIL